jgi:hypothetical protein
LGAASEAITGYARIRFYGGEQHIRNDLFFEQRRGDRNTVQCRLNVGDLQKASPPLLAMTVSLDRRSKSNRARHSMCQLSLDLSPRPFYGSSIRGA